MRTLAQASIDLVLGELSTPRSYPELSTRVARVQKERGFPLVLPPGGIRELLELKVRLGVVEEVREGDRVLYRLVGGGGCTREENHK